MTDSEYKGRGEGDGGNEGWCADGKIGCHFFQHLICKYSNFANCPKTHFTPV